MVLIALLVALQTTPAPPLSNPEPEPEDIVITAVQDKCVVRFADKDMTDAEFDRRAAEWKAGTPVRVFVRADADFACARKISKQLFDRGVTKILFVDPQGKPALPFDPPKSGLRFDAAPGAPGSSTGTWMETRAREHSFVARAAAQLILQGKCAEARDMALREGDLDAAAAVVEICRK